MAETNLTKDNFDEIINGGKPVLVDFWAEWCGPCQMMLPVVAELAEEQKDIVVAKVNIDENGEVAEKFHVMSVPTFLMFKDGKVINQLVGAVPKDALEEMIEKATKD